MRGLAWGAAWGASGVLRCRDSGLASFCTGTSSPGRLGPNLSSRPHPDLSTGPSRGSCGQHAAADALADFLAGGPEQQCPTSMRMVSSLQRSLREEATEPCEMVATWLRVLGGPWQ